jgi:hypothetical protein
MNAITCFLAGATLLVSSLRVAAHSEDKPLAEKVQFCALVAEVKVDSVRVHWNFDVLLDEFVCTCTVLRALKIPTPTNSVTLAFLKESEKDISYEGKSFLVFAFSDKSVYRPYGAEQTD